MTYANSSGRVGRPLGTVYTVHGSGCSELETPCALAMNFLSDNIDVAISDVLTPETVATCLQEAEGRRPPHWRHP